MNAGEYYDHKTNRTKRAYRDLPPRVVQVLAGWIIPVLGGVALKISALEKADREARQKEAASFQQAVRDLA